MFRIELVAAYVLTCTVAATSLDSVCLVQKSVQLIQPDPRHHPRPHHAGPTDSIRAKVLAGQKGAIPTLPPAVVTGAPHTAAEASGVAGNGAVDGYAFITATITNSVMICVFVGIFMGLRNKFPKTYSNNLTWETEEPDAKYTGFAPTKALGGNPGSTNQKEIRDKLESTWGWWTASMDTTTQEVADTAGLDMAMLLEFCNLGMKMLMKIGVPMMCIIGPMNCAFGGQPAWAIGDYLSSFSFGNVENGSWLYWVHAFVVWYVVLIVQSSIYEAQGAFLELRFRWLHKMAEKRANTILVEGIPDEYREAGKLKEFFGNVFGDEQIASTYAVINTLDLDPLVAKHKAAVQALDESYMKWKNAAGKTENETPGENDASFRPKTFGGTDLIDYHTTQCAELKKQIEEHEVKIEDQKKTNIEEAAAAAAAAAEADAKPAARSRLSSMGFETPQLSLPVDDKCGPGDFTWSGFVTFKERKYAQMAVNQLYSADKDAWIVSCPPEPNDLIWRDLQLSPKKGQFQTALGYAAVVGLYLVYLPIVIGIAQAAVSVDMGAFEAVWLGLAPTLGLQLMVAFLPTFLLLIFRTFWVLKADTLAQKRLQTYYFWFQIVFVVLVTAIGSDAIGFTMTVFTDPLALPDLLGAAMPPATHFYMNFLVLQWVTHAQGLARHVILLKYIAFTKLYSEEEAAKLAEPEDQDYYGMGSRSARFTINMVIGIVYGTLSPPITLLCWLNFYMCRLAYGYLIPFAETKKPDLGGPFWVEQLKHLFVANIIYCIAMCGVLSARAEVTGFQPVTIAAPSLIYVLWSFNRFERAFSWEELPIPKIIAGPGEDVKKRALEGLYEQEMYKPKEQKGY